MLILSTFAFAGSAMNEKGKGLHYCTPFRQFSFLLTYDLFAKDLRAFETCLLVKNNLYGILVWSEESPTIFDERVKVKSVKFFIPNFNFLSCKLQNITFKVLYWSISY